MIETTEAVTRLRSFLITRKAELIGVRATLLAASIGIPLTSGKVIDSRIRYLQNQRERVNIETSLVMKTRARYHHGL